MDHERLAIELIRALRGRHARHTQGPRSQRALSRRLGYSTNVVYSWESGRRFPTAGETLRLASQVGVDLRVALRAFFTSDPPELETARLSFADLVVAILREVRGDSPVSELARNTGLGRSSVSRWLSGRGDPRLPDFLCILGYRTLDLIATLVDPATLPAATEHWSRLRVRRTLAYDDPNTEIVVLALDLDAYRALPQHEDAALAQMVDIGPEEAARALSALVRAGAARWDGRRYVPEQQMSVAMDQEPERLRALKHHWSRLGTARTLNPTAEDRLSYVAFAASEAAFDRIREAHARYLEGVIQILEADDGSERVGIVNAQLVTLGRDIRVG